MCDTEFIQQPSMRARRSRLDIEAFQELHDVGFNGQLTKYGSFLWKVADSVLRSHVHGEVGYIFLPKHHRTIIGPGQTNDDVKSCGLARTIRPE
jgi:hypothetical protein